MGTENIKDDYVISSFEGLKGNNVYIDRSLLNLNNKEYLDTDLIGLEVYMNEELLGIIDDITYINDKKKLLIVNHKYIPFELIKDIDFKNKKIILEEVIGL